MPMFSFIQHHNANIRLSIKDARNIKQIDSGVIA